MTYEEFRAWVLEVTGLTCEEIMEVLNKPRDEWPIEVVKLTIAILVVTDEVQVFTCGEGDIDELSN